METKTIRANKARLINGSVIPSYARIMQTAQYEHFNVRMEEWSNTSFKDINSTTRILNTTNNRWSWLTPPALLADSTLKSSRRLPSITSSSVETGRYVFLWDSSIDVSSANNTRTIFEFSSTSTRFRFGVLKISNDDTVTVQYMDTYTHRGNKTLGSGDHVLEAVVSNNVISFVLDGVGTSRTFNMPSSSPLYWYFYNMSEGTLTINEIGGE